MGLINHFRDDMDYEPRHDDGFGYGLREQADIKEDLIKARKLLTRAVLVGGLNKPLVVEINKFLNKLSNK